MLHQAYFQELRTEQQLGYVVSVSNRPIAKRGGISFIVQSPNTSAAGLENATLSFMNEFLSGWPEVTAAELEEQKSGLINRLLEKPKNLNERSQRYWADLSEELYTFDSRQQVADLVNALTLEDMEAFFTRLQKLLGSDRLLIYTQGRFDDVPQQGQVLSDATQSWEDASSS
jgi:secreted Zn-dependent insulinase-like peptidase